MEATGSHRPRRVLVVDDDRLILALIEDFFSPHGYQIERAENGRAALERIEACLPDVIIADVLMPEMDGWELFEAVRRRPAAADTPFVFLTTEADLPKRLRGLHMGADDYVTKPFAVEELHARIERILANRERPSLPADLWLAGSVEHLPLTDLLQLLSLNGKDAIVDLRRAAETGKVWFETGRPVHALSGRARGEKALYRMLGWFDARFRVMPGASHVPERTLAIKVTDAVMNGLVALDEWNRLQDALPDASMRLVFADDARDRLINDKVTPAEFDVMARSKRGRSIAEILDESQLLDSELARAICDLLERGVVRPVAA